MSEAAAVHIADDDDGEKPQLCIGGPGDASLNGVEPLAALMESRYRTPMGFLTGQSSIPAPVLPCDAVDSWRRTCPRDNSSARFAKPWRGM